MISPSDSESETIYSDSKYRVMKVYINLIKIFFDDSDVSSESSDESSDESDIKSENSDEIQDNKCTTFTYTAINC